MTKDVGSRFPTGRCCAAGGVVVGRVVGEDVGVRFANDDVGGSTVGGEVN